MMTKRNWALALLAVTWSAAGCSSDTTPAATPLGIAGAPATGTAGASGLSGVSGVSGAGSSGSAGTEAGGGVAVSSGAGGMSDGDAGGAGAPMSAGGAGGAGGAGASGGGAAPTPSGPSAGCKTVPPGSDSPSNFVKHDVEVTEPMDATVLAANPVPAGKIYNWQHRNYFVRLPKNYDNTKPYQLSIGGSGCGGSETVGSEGGYALLGGDQTQEVQVALSYVTANSACFKDDYTNPPDVQYFDAMLADVEAHYCIDKSKVFVHGYSSGAWETYLLGCARRYRSRHLHVPRR